ncbi:F-box/kelch-repeat protein [Raphanus sativus]|uniref:F-box/kelch-repeat protein At3g16740-like n=1 Tax=Raphanus sativus TaxID=3726 RepID=A0A6J0K099_RAPSA|nr:F-box/kelch-repeat protein At3g16740-like [Raphanus sativus]KAJ4873196.1 F-box/kelch-repeat protein [Raphanus sativus]
MMSDLPRDMEEEVLSKLPMTSLRRARFTCKRWNNSLSKNLSFTKKYKNEAAKRKEEYQVVMMLEYKVYLMSVNLLNPSPSIEPIGKLFSLDDATHDGVDIGKIFHCDGLLLCVTKDRTRLVVWNPFNGQTRWIQPRDTYHSCDRYALGYENTTKYSRRSHKVLRFVDDYDHSLKRRVCEFEIFNLNTSSWKVVDFNPGWMMIQYFYRGLSLKGNTYWFAEENLVGKIGRVFLLCFNFTTESFGPRLPLPFRGRYGDTLSLSSVREEQLAVLFQKSDAPAYTLKVWISSKVGPNAVSWHKVFLSVDMKPFTGFQFLNYAGSFFVDEKKKVVVVIDMTRSPPLPIRNMAYIIGENGYFKTVDLGDFANRNCWPLVCSYVPSSVKINQASPLGNQRNTRS